MQATDCFAHFQAVELKEVKIHTDTTDSQEVRMQHPWFFVSLRLVHGAIRIDNLTVYDRYQRRGIGSRVVQVLRRFADEQRVALLAANVLPDSIGFWRSRRVGFIPDATNPDDFLPPHHVARTRRMPIVW